MRLTVARVLIAILALSASITSHTLANELDERLQFLEPLIGIQWVGGFVESESSDIEISLSFEPVLGGSAVRYAREVEALGFSALTHFYWHPGRGEIRFMSLYNREIVGEGVVSSEDGKIVLRGKSHYEDKTVEFETTIEIDPKGRLRDTFLRMEDGKWVQGHVQEFVAKE